MQVLVGWPASRRRPCCYWLALLLLFVQLSTLFARQLSAIMHLSVSIATSQRPDPPAAALLCRGMGSDGTVGANKEAVKIIANQEGMFAQVRAAAAGHNL